MLIVFLNNKLITCDTILPLVAELKAKAPEAKVEFYFMDSATEAAIRANIVLYDLLVSLGTLHQLGRDKTKGLAAKYAHRVRSLATMVRLAWLSATGKTALLHFKALDEWPLRLLAVLAKGRVWYAQGSAAGVAALETKVSEMMEERNYDTNTPAADHLIYFCDAWRLLSDGRIGNKPRFRLPAPFTYPAFLGWLEDRSNGYIDRALSDVGPPGSAVVTYILSSMDPNGLLREPDLFPTLFRQTLDCLRQSGCTDPILIKPHPATLPHTMDLIRREVGARPEQKIVICHLHPVVLARRSRFVIGNCYSTTFSVFHAMQVPTVEFTDYRPDILQTTNGGSFRPDLVNHFVNGDTSLLLALLLRLQQREPQNKIEGSAPQLPHGLVTAFAR